MLEKVWAKVEPRPQAGFVAGGRPGAAQHHLMLTVVAGRTEVIVIPMYLSAGQRIEVIFQPLPDIAEHVMEPCFGGLAGIDRAGGAASKIKVPALFPQEGRPGVAHHWIDLDAEDRRLPLLIGAYGLMLCFAGQPAGCAFLLSSPGAVSLGFVVVDLDRPIPGHVDNFKQGAQAVAMQAGRAVRDPERRLFAITKRAPFPAGI